MKNGQTRFFRLNWISGHIDELDGVNLENGKFHIERLEKDVPDKSRNFSLTLYELIPRIKLTDLLMEVANWTNFHEQFIHASSNRTPNEEETTILMATSSDGMRVQIGVSALHADANPHYWTGTDSASLIMGKLGSYARQNSLATAHREMGRIDFAIIKRA